MSSTSTFRIGPESDVPLTLSTAADRAALSFDDIESLCDQFLVSRTHGSHLARELRQRVLAAGIYFGGGPLPTYPKPHIVPSADEERWGATAERVVGVFESVGHALLADQDLRARIGLPPGSEPLLEIDPGYGRLVIVSRLDMVWSGRMARALELNADSPAMMTFTDRLEELLLGLGPIGDLLAACRFRPQQRTRALYDAILATYLEWGGSRRDPSIAVVDWEGESTANELQHTAADFESFGSPTVVCDPRELSIHDGRLHARGRRIDIVQRRVLFPDFVRRPDELATLLEAYRRGVVCVVNPLRSYMVGNKAAFAMVSQGAFGLSPSDRETVAAALPATEIVSRESCDRLVHEREDWVLKGAFGSGGKGVSIGCFTSPSEWRERVEAAASCRTVAQRFQSISRIRVPTESSAGDMALTELYANWNPWVFAGRYAGATTRISRQPVVAISGSGALLAPMSARLPGPARPGGGGEPT